MDFHEKLIEGGIEGDFTSRDLKRDTRAVSFQINLSDDTPTECVVRVYGTLDNNNFAPMITHTLTDDELSARTSLFHLVNKPSIFYKVEIYSLVGDAPLVADIYWGGAYV